MQTSGFICRSCLFQLRSLARRQPIRYGSALAQQVTSPAEQVSLPAEQITLPASDLALYSERAPWFLKRRIRRKIEKELYTELPKLQRKHKAKKRSPGRPAILSRWLEDDDPEIEKEMERNDFREVMARRLFFQQPRQPEEIKKYHTWKSAFHILTLPWREEIRPKHTASQNKGGRRDSSSVEDSRQEPRTADGPGRLGLDPADYSEARDELAELLSVGDENAVHEKWMSRTWGDREVTWPHLALVALAFFPRSACLFLRATWEKSICPIYIIHDAVWFLIRRPAVMQSEAAAQDLCDLLTFFLKHARREGFQIRQWDIYMIVKSVLSDEAIHAFYQQLVISKHPLHRYTRLQFARRFGETVAFKPTAFEILEFLVQAGELDINSPHVGALCTTILTPSKKALEEAFTPGKFVEGTEMLESSTKYSERLLQLGFNPNLITYSVLIRDLIQRREVKTALDVLKIMTSQDLKPDALLYSYLLYGAKTSGSWLPMHMLVQQAFLDEIRDPVVWNELLHTVFMAYLGEVRRQRGRRKVGMPAFHPMLKIYASIFKPDLLRKFIPADMDHLVKADLHVSNIWQCEKQAFLLAYRTPSWNARGLLDPGYDTVTIMILGYINSLSNPQSILEFYLHFKRLVDHGDADALHLVEKGATRIYDYILKALLQWEEHLGTSVGLVNDMLKLSGESPLQEQSFRATASSRPLSVAPATVTGSGSGSGADELSLDRLSLSSDLRSAELGETGIAQPMKAALTLSGPQERFRHPAPSVHTWSILINGLMFHREADKAEKVMEIMQEHGVEPSIVPYNTLMAGYANAQNVRKTVKTLQRLEAAGFEGDDYTFKAWAYLTDKEAALELMEGVEAARTKRLLLLRQRADHNEKPAPVSAERFRAEMEAWEGVNSGLGTGVEVAYDDYDSALQDVERQIRDAAR
ncbi:hypothetical protein BR93DRAFT_929901 [Coniochaeta sp. PMI_546]|nr:hypothetical protein BR93DRAFT_929901 [Coniochaeta sp. PMI_546]